MWSHFPDLIEFKIVLITSISMNQYIIRMKEHFFAEYQTNHSNSFRAVNRIFFCQPKFNPSGFFFSCTWKRLLIDTQNSRTNLIDYIGSPISNKRINVNADAVRVFGNWSYKYWPRLKSACQTLISSLTINQARRYKSLGFAFPWYRNCIQENM